MSHLDFTEHRELPGKLRAYLLWYETWHTATDWKQIGETDSPAQNPPALSEENMFCWNWYAANVAGGLTVKLGLLPTLLAGLRMGGISREIFVKKIGLIAEMFERMAQGKD